jgi:hypothetical protein
MFLLYEQLLSPKTDSCFLPLATVLFSCQFLYLELTALFLHLPGDALLPELGIPSVFTQLVSLEPRLVNMFYLRGHG